MKDFLEIHDFHGLNEIKRTMFFLFKAPKPAGKAQNSLSTNWGRGGAPESTRLSHLRLGAKGDNHENNAHNITENNRKE